MPLMPTCLAGPLKSTTTTGTLHKGVNPAMMMGMMNMPGTWVVHLLPYLVRLACK